MLPNYSKTIQAWRGDVKEVIPFDGSHWQITNKCYNNKLYSCQCLDLGVILRYAEVPTLEVSFNGVTIPECGNEPDCAPDVNNNNCPYRLDPESELLCQLVTELNQLASNSTSYHSSSNAVNCPYLDNPTSAFLLCNLWCQVQGYLGNTCTNTTTLAPTTTAPICPYLSYTNQVTLCDLWLSLQSLTLSTPVTSASPTLIVYSTCPHFGLADAILACELWCQVNQLQSNTICSGGPTCPYENYTVPHDVELCKLWAENLNLEGVVFGSSSSTPTDGLTPIYTTDPTASTIISCKYFAYPYNDDYCGLWCENQFYMYGQVCEQFTSTSGPTTTTASTCPYETYTESATLCSLWQQLNNLATSGNTPPITSSIEYTNCPYLSLSDSVVACTLWCEIEQYSSGSVCTGAPTSTEIFTGSSSSTTTVATTIAMCLYESFPNALVLCALWNQIIFLEGNGNTPTISTSISYSSCPYLTLSDGILACELWCQLQELATQTECSGSPVCPYKNYTTPHDNNLCELWSENLSLENIIFGSTSPSSTDGITPLYSTNSAESGTITCEYNSYPYSSDYCDLWCESQFYKYGQTCVAETTTTQDPCPYDSHLDATDLCYLWNEINNVQASGVTVAPIGTIPYNSCPYLSNNDPSLTCELWCQLENLNSGYTCEDGPSSESTTDVSTTNTNTPTTTIATCPYEEYTDTIVLCFLWQQIEREKNGGSTIHSVTFTVPYSTCPHVGITDNILACEMWCQLQEYTAWALCLNGPVCPYQNYTSPYNDELCTLWAENVNIEENMFGSTTPTSLDGITPLFSTDISAAQIISCIYRQNRNVPPYTDEFCSIWCETQYYKYGYICEENVPSTTLGPSTTEVYCPYSDSADSEVLCFLYGQLENEKSSGSTVHSVTFEVQYSKCPHLGLIDGVLACEMWCQLQSYTAWAFCTNGPVCPYENYTSPHNNELCHLWSENVNIENNLFGSTTPSSLINFSPLYSTESTENSTIQCIYESNVIYKIEYCDIWCETQLYKFGQTCEPYGTTTPGSTTTTEAVCPYLHYDEPVLCFLWTQLESEKSSGSTIHSVTFSVEYNGCPHLGLDEALLACEMWCQLQEWTAWSYCQNKPSCPYESYTSPYNDQLCTLWAENLHLESLLFGSTTPASIDNITPLFTTDSSSPSIISCIYRDQNYPYADDFCVLWCESQYYQYGQICEENIPTTFNSTSSGASTIMMECPYEDYTDNTVLCFLWQQIEIEEYNGATIGSVTFPVEYTACPHVDLTDGLLACEMWCQLQEYTAWAFCSNGPICPYENYTSPDNDELCRLWAENTNIKNNIFGSTTPGSYAGITPLYSTDATANQLIQCIFGSMNRNNYIDEKCQIWCETQFLKYGQICEEYSSTSVTTTQTTTIIICPYLENTDSTLLCFLWNQLVIEKQSGSTINAITFSVQYSSCPHFDLVDSVIACEMWCELQEWNAWTYCLNKPVCPYENYTSPHNTDLCELWKETQNLENQIFGSTTPISLSSITPLYSTDATLGLTIPCVYSSDLSNIYVDEYCSLWCKLQFYKYGQNCIVSNTTTESAVESCPYEIYDDSVILCFLWQNLITAQENGATVSSNTFAIPYTSCPHLGLTNGILACQIWCETQELTAWTVCTNSPLCPYDDFPSPHNNDLCNLWAENINLENTLFGVTNPSTTDGFTPIHSTDATESSTIICIYESLDYSTEYCNLWCESQLYKYGKVCVEATTSTLGACPYSQNTDSETLCSLWQQINILSSQGTVTNSIGSPVTDTNGNVVTLSNIAVTDNNGIVVTDASGNPVTQILNSITDSSGNTVTDSIGYPVTQPANAVTDSVGNLVTDSTGNIVTSPLAYVTDSSGNTITDSNGKPINAVTDSSGITLTDDNGNIVTDSSTVLYSTCPHLSLPESILACELWCQIQELLGNSCSGVPTTQPATQEPCPYLDLPDSSTLCALWQQIMCILGSLPCVFTDSNGNVVTDTNGNPVTIPENAVTNSNGNTITNLLGNLVTEAVIALTDSNGIIVTNTNGNPVTYSANSVTDVNGNVVTNVEGNAVTAVPIIVTDLSGNAITESNGNIVTYPPNAVTDSNGNVVTDSNGNVITDSIVFTDSSGNVITDTNGNPVTYPSNTVTDSNGNVVTDSNGNVITNSIVFTDSSGNVITDTNGNPVTYPPNAVTDINGNTVTDSSGNAVTEAPYTFTDSSGNVITDLNGNPITYSNNVITDVNGNIVTDSNGNPVTQTNSPVTDSSGNIVTDGNGNIVTLTGQTVPYSSCPFISDTNWDLSCQLWCQLQELSLGVTCYESTTVSTTITENICPYLSYTESEILCYYWQQIELSKHTGSTIHQTTFTIEYTSCPNKDLVNGILACELWCQLQEYTAWTKCLNSPICPYANYTSPHNEDLCNLWVENQSLENIIFGATSTPTSLTGITPLYSTEATQPQQITCSYNAEGRQDNSYVDEYCSIWCETQFYKYGQTCIDLTSTTSSSASTTTEVKVCPYETYTDSVVLCFVWNQLEIEKISGSTIYSFTFSIPYTSCPHSALTDGLLACEMWCKLQEYTSWTFCSNGPYSNCPYDNYTNIATLCSLWQQINILSAPVTVTDESGNPVTDSNGTMITQIYNVVTSNNGNVVTDNNGNLVTEPANVITDASGNIVTDVNGIPLTEQQNAATDSNGNTVTDSLGNLITNSPIYVTDTSGFTATDLNGNLVTEPSTIDYNSCPFLDLTDGEKACELWCQIQGLESDVTCTNVPTSPVPCPYESYTNSVELCTLWQQINQLSVPITVTDENGNIVTDPNGNTVTQPYIAVTDSNGNLVTDNNGNQVTELKNPVTYLNGNPVTYSNGNPVTDTNGNPITQVANAITDTNGITATDSLGNVVTKSPDFATDSSGNTATDSSGNAVTELATLSYNSCPHVNLPDGQLACEMWCQLQHLYFGNQCVGIPSTTTAIPCPYLSYTDGATLCSLWIQLNAISNPEEVTDQSGNPVTDINGNPVTQSYVAVTDSDGNIVTNAYGNPITQVANVITDESGVAVTDSNGNSVTEVANAITDSNGNTVTDILGSVVTESPIYATDSNGITLTDNSGIQKTEPSTIPYSSCPHLSLTDAELACTFWCQIQEKDSGSVCTGIPTTPTPCPYQLYTNSDELCSLWQQINALSSPVTVTDQSGSPITDANGNAVTLINSVVTDNSGNVVTDNNGNLVTEIVNGITDSNGVPVTDSNGNPATQLANVVTDASGNTVTNFIGIPVTVNPNAVTDSNGITVTDNSGFVVTEPSQYVTDSNGSTLTDSNGIAATEPVTVPYNSCPHINLPDSDLACQLWCQLQELESGTICTEFPSTTTAVPCPYLGYTDEIALCSLWQQLNTLSNPGTVTDQSGNLVTDSSGNPVSQIYEAITDSNGNVITDAIGNLITQLANGVTDSNGSPITNSNGVPVTEPPNAVTDIVGNVITDSNGNFITESPNPATDVSGNTITDASGNLVTEPSTILLSSCPYISLSEGVLACQMWCEIQEKESGSVCIESSSSTIASTGTTLKICPYLEYQENTTLCYLWGQIEEEKENGATVPPSFIFTIPYVYCPFKSTSDEFLACNLWCELQSFTALTECTNKPVCPYENYTSPHDDNLCNLWAENVNIENNLFGSTTPSSLSGLTPMFSTQPSDSTVIACIYDSYLYSEDYCDIWCETQLYKYGQICSKDTTTVTTTSTTTLTTTTITTPTTTTSTVGPSTTTVKTCPYEDLVDKDVLCYLWWQIETEKEGGSTIHPTTYTIPYIACPYQSITNNLLACELWCVMHEYSAWTYCTNKPVCPYENYTSPHDETLCLLWTENINLENTIFGSSTPASIDGITPLYSTDASEAAIVECIYDNYLYSDEYCTIWCESQFYKYGQICSFQTTSTTTTTTTLLPCPYAEYTDSVTLCSLWQQINGIKENSLSTPALTSSIPYTSCPHTGSADSILACQLWCELQELESGLACTSGPVCPYENYTAPHNTDLCNLWAENLNIETNLFSSSSPFSTDPLYSTQSTETNVIPCIFESYQHSSDYCSIWCETQFYKYGQICEQYTTSTTLDASTTPLVCPYLDYTDSEILCYFWNQIYSSESSGTTIHTNTYSIPYAVCPHREDVDGILICQLWCRHLELTAWTVCTGTPVCPYENYTSPNDIDLCELWAENQSLENIIFGTSVTPGSTDGLTALFSTDATENLAVTCPYADNTLSEEYCTLWCENQFYKYGQICTELPTTSNVCPYAGYYEAELLCNLYESLGLVQNGYQGTGTYSTIGQTTNIVVTDSLGNTVTNSDGSLVTLPSNVVTDGNGQTLTDTSGNLVTGIKGHLQWIFY